jgi:hypothetical protein
VLFLEKYTAAYGVGIILPKNRTKLKFVYRPASASFRGYGQIARSFGDIPDVTVLTGPLKKLQALVDACSKELESYSRYCGKNPNTPSALEGLLQRKRSTDGGIVFL